MVYIGVNGVNITGDFSPIYFAKSLSVTDITLMTIWCIGSTILISFLAGAASGRILAAAAIGFAIGTILSVTVAKLFVTMYLM